MTDQTVIVDSDMTFAEAIFASAAPTPIIDSLSLVDVRYYSFDGLRHAGQIVVCAELEEDLYEIFAFLEEIRFPVGKAIPIAAYSWDDEASMADNNSSSFNFRFIANTEKLSLHAFGRAVDINPVQNPVIYPSGLVAPPGARYAPSAPGALSGSSPVVREFLKRGWCWGGHFDQPKDYHHFEKP